MSTLLLLGLTLCPGTENFSCSKAANTHLKHPVNSMLIIYFSLIGIPVRYLPGIEALSCSSEASFLSRDGTPASGLKINS